MPIKYTTSLKVGDVLVLPDETEVNILAVNKQTGKWGGSERSSGRHVWGLLEEIDNCKIIRRR